MKKLLLSLVSVAAVALGVVGCSKSEAQISLRYNSPDTTVFYALAPVEGVSFGITDTIRLAGDTTYTQTVTLADGVSPYTLVAFGAKGRSQVNLAISGGDRLAVDYVTGDGFSIDTTSTAYAGQWLYDSLTRANDIYKYEWVRNFNQAPLDTLGEVMLQNFEAEAAADKAKFARLKEQGAINAAFADFVTTAIDYNVALSMSKAMRSWSYYAERNGKALNTSYCNVWPKVRERYPVTAASLRSNSGLEFAKVSVMYDGMLSDTSYVFPSFTDNRQAIEWQDSIFRAALGDKVELKRPFMAQWLYNEALNNKTHNTVIDSLIEAFAVEYPANGFSPYLARFVIENKVYHEKIKAPFSPEVLFLQDTAGIKTLADVFSKFKGRDLFVDFWFSTCGSCIEEFAHAAALSNFLKANDIDMLYVSIDRDNMAENWKNLIKVHDLKGSHIRVNRATHVDMDATHGIIYFPRYMIVDKNGVIVERSAKAPSSGSELYDQIKISLKKI